MNRMIEANPESRILERIAAVVGYEGQNSDDMIAAVEAMAANADNSRQLARLRSLLQMPVAPLSQVVDQVEHIVAALEAGSAVDADLLTANNRVDELETVISQIREAFDGPLPFGADLAAEVSRLVARHRSNLKYIKKIDAAIGGVNMPLDEAIRYLKDMEEQARIAQPVAMEQRTSGRHIESYILDLSLMTLRGEVTGLDPDFISAMREAV